MRVPSGTSATTSTSSVSATPAVSVVAEAGSTPVNTLAPKPSATVPLPEEVKSVAPPAVSLTAIRNNLKDQARLQQEARRAAQANRREVTSENLIPAWQEAVEKIAADKGMYKASLLLSDVVYSHPTIKVSALLSCFDFIKQRRLELLNFFKLYYSDEDLNVLIDQKADEEPKERILSTREVFDAMAQKNPALKALKEQLGLDLEL